MDLRVYILFLKEECQLFFIGIYTYLYVYLCTASYKENLICILITQSNQWEKMGK